MCPPFQNKYNHLDYWTCYSSYTFFVHVPAEESRPGHPREEKKCAVMPMNRVMIKIKRKKYLANWSKWPGGLINAEIFMSI